MGWSNPPIPWSEFERKLSDSNRPATGAGATAVVATPVGAPPVGATAVGATTVGATPVGATPVGATPVGADGGDSPAWSNKRQPYRLLAERATAVAGAASGGETTSATTGTGDPQVEPERVPYAELHAHSNFSFLDGASSPEALLEEAARLKLDALALTDHDGLYGIVRMAEAAAAHNAAAQKAVANNAAVQKNNTWGIGTLFGAELSLGLHEPQNGIADPEGTHLLVLARKEAGYHLLAGALTSAQLAGSEKGRPLYDLDELAERAAGQWVILTGCRKGSVRQALVNAGTPSAGFADATAEVQRLIERFGRDNVLVELIDHGNPLDSSHNDALAEIAAATGLPTVATGNVHYATPTQRRLATAVAAVRARRSLDEMDGWLPASGSAHLRSGREMERRFRRYPGAVARTVAVANEIGFELRKAKPGLPKQEVPAGHTAMSWLRQLVWDGAPTRRVELTPENRARIERELEVIEAKDFPGYFLIVHDIVDFARGRGILCQGRGSAANSAVCYLLGITAVDPIFYKLPFERFLSSMRDEEPDIDVDFDSARREEVIQYVYAKYGRHNAAQVANVISYRPKFAVRDMAKALGHSPGQQDVWSQQIERHGALLSSDEHEIPAPVVELALEVMKFPRHLGIHSGGMVLTDRPVGEVVPIEHARMENRTVVQWDKDDCAWMGLVKFDLLGLGMLSALQHSFDLVREHLGEEIDLDLMPKEEAGVFDMLCQADSIGVFQVESRAQMGLLPRLQPRRFYDLVVEIALIRPGPIQGGAVHPYVRRKLGQEPVTYLHPKLVEPLERTLGIPVFQEQLMQVAMAVGGCTGEDADLLRRAMGSKRGVERIESLRATLYAGMAGNGITGEVADEIYSKIQAFANFGFAESHSLSFGLLVYASSWVKLHYPAAFLASLLRAQPMGFYSRQTLVADARRHGVEVFEPDILRSGATSGIEAAGPADGGLAAGLSTAGLADGLAAAGLAAGLSTAGLTDGLSTAGLAAGPASGDQAGSDRHAPATGRDSCLDREQPAVPVFDRHAEHNLPAHRRDGNHVVRLGLSEVKGIGLALAERIVHERERGGDFESMAELVRRVGINTAQLESLAAAGAFDSLGLSRREALWTAGNAALDRAEYLPDTLVAVQPPLFTMPSEAEQLTSDLWATGISPRDHPIRHLRRGLDDRGVYSAFALKTAESGRRIEVGGVITHRQRPATASGITFMNVEDETGLINVICSVGVWNRYRRVARDASAMVIRGVLERSPEGVINLLADRLEDLPLDVRTVSRDFR